MKKTFYYTSVLLAVSVILVLSCKKEYSCEGCAAGNLPPIADAGPDQLIAWPTNTIVLNGTASMDPDGNIKIWRWTKIAGPASFQIANPDSATSVVKNLMPGIYNFELKVTDDKGAEAVDAVQIKVNAPGSNQPPIACAGPDKTIALPSTSVLLDGSCSTDPDYNISSYVWTKIAGPSSFSIANSNVAQTQVSSLAEGTYLFELKVTDAEGLFSMDTVKIIVKKYFIDIYVAGMENSKATYWKNGQAVILPSTRTAVATSIAVVGNNVYVAGQEGNPYYNQAYDRAMYWKNGQEIFLTGPTGAGATSIAVSGNDVYVAGWEFNDSVNVAKYWKNGQEVALSDGSTEASATCIVVSNGNVYVSGFENGIAKYWKNGQPVLLNDGSQSSSANSIAVVGNDIYVAGYGFDGSVHIAKYWKNGQPVNLTTGSNSGLATSIAVAGNNVYVAGYEFEGNSNNAIAKYWKNGQPVTLTNSTSFGMASSIAIWGNDVYVAGTIRGNATYNNLIQYWENGQTVPLSGPSWVWAMNIIVVPN